MNNDTPEKRTVLELRTASNDLSETNSMLVGDREVISHSSEKFKQSLRTLTTSS